MSQVVVKGESVYECDVCTRKTRVPTNRFGLDVLQRCTITQNCKGVLHKVRLARDINNTPAFPPEIEGLENWFQRRILFTHEQAVESKTWIVEHNLGNKPVLHLYVNKLVDGVVTLVAQEPDSARTIDLNKTELTFERAYSGLVQCVTLASTNVVNSTATSAPAVSTEPLQITNNSGEISIATLSSASAIDLTLTFTTASTVPNVEIEYVSIDTTASLTSPWVGVRRVVINGRRYTVRSFNIAATANAAVAFEAGLVPSGSAFKITGLEGEPIAQHDVLILTARSPFASVDRVYDKYVDAASISATDPETYWENGKAYCRLAAVKNVYPAILVV